MNSIDEGETYMKNKMIAFMILITVVVSGCSLQKQEEEEAKFLDVQLSANPVNAEAGQDITFEAKVTYGNENVEDADEVKFEIWRSNDEKHEKVVVKHSENGVYKLNKSFEEEGTYYVISHVSARSQHSMPKKEFVVGQPSEPESHSETNDSHMETEKKDENNQH